MAVFNPDLLLKDELCYEAILRGLSHANVTVSELRKSLRESRSDIPSQLDRLRELDYDSERETCYAKMCIRDRPYTVICLKVIVMSCTVLGK